MPCSDLLSTLCHSGHLLRANDDHYRRQEQRSIVRLLARPRRTYLQEYDLLFRYVSWWLLERGYVLTGHQPHQVLARVCAQLISPTLVAEVVRARHTLKYQDLPPTPTVAAALDQLLATLAPAWCISTKPVGL